VLTPAESREENGDGIRTKENIWVGQRLGSRKTLSSKVMSTNFGIDGRDGREERKRRRREERQGRRTAFGSKDDILVEGRRLGVKN